MRADAHSTGEDSVSRVLFTDMSVKQREWSNDDASAEGEAGARGGWNGETGGLSCSGVGRWL
jgi:hypothetical protein